MLKEAYLGGGIFGDLFEKKKGSVANVSVGQNPTFQSGNNIVGFRVLRSRGGKDLLSEGGQAHRIEFVTCIGVGISLF